MIEFWALSALVIGSGLGVLLVIVCFTFIQERRRKPVPTSGTLLRSYELGNGALSRAAKTGRAQRTFGSLGTLRLRGLDHVPSLCRATHPGHLEGPADRTKVVKIPSTSGKLLTRPTNTYRPQAKTLEGDNNTNTQHVCISFQSGRSSFAHEIWEHVPSLELAIIAGGTGSSPPSADRPPSWAARIGGHTPFGDLPDQEHHPPSLQGFKGFAIMPQPDFSELTALNTEPTLKSRHGPGYSQCIFKAVPTSSVVPNEDSTYTVKVPAPRRYPSLYRTKRERHLSSHAMICHAPESISV